MTNLFPLLTILSLLIYVTSNPIEYDSLSTADCNSNSRSDDQIENDDENVSLSEDISQRLYKRQIDSDNESTQLSLSEIIENIEDSLLDSALQATNIMGILKSDTVTKSDDNVSNEKDIEHFVAKREDDDNNTETSSQIVLTHFKAREVPITDDHLAHVAVDRVTVYVANQSFLPMIPSFDLHLSGLQHENIKELIENAKSSKNSSSDENDKTESSIEISTETISDETNSEITTTTTKIPTKKTAEELKEVEEELKEKVAEVEAEPIILSARV